MKNMTPQLAMAILISYKTGKHFFSDLVNSLVRIPFRFGDLNILSDGYISIVECRLMFLCSIFMLLIYHDLWPLDDDKCNLVKYALNKRF